MNQSYQRRPIPQQAYSPPPAYPPQQAYPPSDLQPRASVRQGDSGMAENFGGALDDISNNNTVGAVLAAPLVFVLVLILLGFLILSAGSKTEMGRAGQFLGANGDCGSQIDPNVWAAMSVGERFLVGAGCVSASK